LTPTAGPLTKPSTLPGSRGETGFPIVDAAARCLQATGGWLALNFRTRAIYASFLSNLLGMDWRYGALHFMRHLIDGDCPIDHYQWAMQAGVTHCLDKPWTRIYNPGQVAVDRCDPDGIFIKRWLPELAHLPADQLGQPPPRERLSPPQSWTTEPPANSGCNSSKPSANAFANGDNVVPYLANLPSDLTPFGSDRIPSDVAWASHSNLTLFPAPLDLTGLDSSQAQALRTWFVAHVNIPPARGRRRSEPAPDAYGQQLSLLG
jgi:deoxyribodipyrimidine photo-lyase